MTAEPGSRHLIDPEKRHGPIAVATVTTALVTFDSTAAAASDPVCGVIGLLAALVSIPTVLKTMVDLFVPQLGAENDLRAVGFALAMIVAVAIAGFAVGNNNERFLTCEDFKVAGADQPPNCTQP